MPFRISAILLSNTKVQKQEKHMSVKNSKNIPSTPVSIGEGATKTVLISDKEGPNFAMRKFTVQPGGSMPMHINLVEHEQYVLNGRARLVIDKEVHEVNSGDVVFIPAEVPHSYENIGDVPFEFLCVVPNKEDKTILTPESE
jgi:quercetin dioxygenase-like cupin family protein